VDGRNGKIQREVFLIKSKTNRLGKGIEELFCEMSKTAYPPYAGKRYVVFSISAETPEGDEAITPCLRYIMS
jgi:hypothetical protein